MKKRQKLLIIFIILIVGSIFWWRNETAPVNKSDTTLQTFVINKGSGVRVIAETLKQAHLIKSPIAFFILVKKLGIEGKIQAGDFKLSPSQSAKEIAKTLTTGIQDIWVTIPEGWRADEIADILKEKIPTYQDSWRQSLDGNEGYLFPDTYLIPRDATIETVLSQMKNNFDTKYQTLSNQYAPHFSEKQIVIIASMIEREAKTPEDQRLVASVIMNRLTIGMALQLDATIQYALGYQQNEKHWWKKSLSPNDLALQTPYNTYLNQGLPPTPISNPGLGALTAAMNPAKTSYFYYISDKKGVNHYAKTLDEHQANIRKYGL